MKSTAQLAWAIARNLEREHRERLDFSPLAGPFRCGLPEAYSAQRCFHELLQRRGAGRIIGYKIALTSKAMQEMVGLDQPLHGAIFESGLHTSPVCLDGSRYCHLGVECEIAVRLGDPLGPRKGRHDRASVADAVATVAPAFELIDDRHADYRRLDAESLVADNCWNAGLVLGRERSDWHGLDLAEAPASVLVKGALWARGKGGDAMGHPFEAVAWMANAFADRGETLPRGSLIMTGSVTRTFFPARGDSLQFTLAGLGSLSLSLAKGLDA